jgi:hypothetical protein
LALPAKLGARTPVALWRTGHHWWNGRNYCGIFPPKVHALLLQLVNCGKILENTLALIGFTPPNLAHGQVALWRTGYQWDGGKYSAPGEISAEGPHAVAAAAQFVNYSCT